MELVHAAEAAAREKNVDREEIFQATEMAIQRAARNKYGHESDIVAAIDRRTGAIKLQRRLLVSDPVENDATQISLKAARRSNPEINIGEYLVDDLPPIDLDRNAAQTAKQVIVQKIRESERHRQFVEYQDRVGEIVSGTVKRAEYGNITVELGRAEAVLRRDESLPREHFKTGDRVRAYIFDVREEQRGPQIFLSRTHPLFMAKLFAQEVPEIYDSVIEIKSVARDPGSRAKIAVVSNDSSIDPVGACVGMRGSRVQAVVGELQGEKVDIIPWSADPATFVVNALAPAEVSKVVMDEENHRMDVVVPDEQLSLAIGRRGQNVRLAAMLTGWDIDILTEQEESDRRQEEMRVRTSLFLDALAVDDVIAHLLVSEGFTKVEQIAETAIDELAEIEGFDAEVAEELQQRARTWLEENAARIIAKRREFGVEDAVVALPYITEELACRLGEKGLKTLDDVGDLAADELREIIGDEHLGESKANEIIMAARKHWFEEAEIK